MRQTGISSADYFGEGHAGGGSGGGGGGRRDYSAQLDGYTGDAPLAHAILHKGLLSRDTLAIAKDKALEAVPEIAGKAGSAVAMAASYIGAR